MTHEGYKCIDCCNCPYYESVTSYGTEEIMCANYNCIHYDSEYMEAESED